MPIVRACAGVGDRRCRATVPPHRTRCDPCAAEHHALERQANRRRHAKQQAQGRNDPAWQALREARLALDSYRCADCLSLATTVHLHARLEGRHDLATLDDLTSLCHRCHGSRDARRAHASIYDPSLDYEGGHPSRETRAHTASMPRAFPREKRTQPLVPLGGEV